MARSRTSADGVSLCSLTDDFQQQYGTGGPASTCSDVSTNIRIVKVGGAGSDTNPDDQQQQLTSDFGNNDAALGLPTEPRSPDEQDAIAAQTG